MIVSAFALTLYRKLLSTIASEAFIAKFASHHAVLKDNSMQAEVAYSSTLFCFILMLKQSYGRCKGTDQCYVHLIKCMMALPMCR